MRVNIYTVDYNNETKGILVGSVDYIGGRVQVEAEDKKIRDLIRKKILNVKNKRKKTENFIYYISTVDFIQLLGIECWKNGYVTEIVG